MPVFNYKCKKCGTEYEGIELQGEKIDKCPKCGSKSAEKLPSASVRIKTSKKS